MARVNEAKKKKPDTFRAGINFARLCSLFLGRLQCGGKNEQMRMSSYESNKKKKEKGKKVPPPLSALSHRCSSRGVLQIVCAAFSGVRVRFHPPLSRHFATLRGGRGLRQRLEHFRLQKLVLVRDFFFLFFP